MNLFPNVQWDAETADIESLINGLANNSDDFMIPNGRPHWIQSLSSLLVQDFEERLPGCPSLYDMPNLHDAFSSVPYDDLEKEWHAAVVASSSNSDVTVTADSYDDNRLVSCFTPPLESAERRRRVSCTDASELNVLDNHSSLVNNNSYHNNNSTNGMISTHYDSQKHHDYHHRRSVPEEKRNLLLPGYCMTRRFSGRTDDQTQFDRRTKPWEVTYVSPPVCSTLRSCESLAPLHIVLPINLPSGKIIIAQKSSQPANTTRELPPHHYYFPKVNSSANQLFSRLHGLCNQSPSWLALDVGYVACREYQVTPVVDLFNTFFSQEFYKLARRGGRKRSSSNCDCSSVCMGPVRLKCCGLRLREDHGTGWFLYETPVEPCSEQDANNFNSVIRLIEMFNERLRDYKLCQNATMKPFTRGQFAIVVLKQEGFGIPDSKLDHASDFKCEGVELSEIRLVRHKIQDKFNNAMFERDPRFGMAEVFGRPIAHNTNGRHGRFVFAEATLPEVIARPAHQIHSIMAEFEGDLEFPGFQNNKEVLLPHPSMLLGSVTIPV